MEKNVSYALVAYGARSGCRIIGDYWMEDASIFRDIVLEVIESVKSSENEKFSIQRGK